MFEGWELRFKPCICDVDRQGPGCCQVATHPAPGTIHVLHGPVRACAGWQLASPSLQLTGLPGARLALFWELHSGHAGHFCTPTDAAMSCAFRWHDRPEWLEAEMPPPHRREGLPKPAQNEKSVSLWSILKDVVGKVPHP